MRSEVLASTDAFSCFVSEICHASGMQGRGSLFEPGVTLDMHPTRLG